MLFASRHDGTGRLADVDGFVRTLALKLVDTRFFSGAVLGVVSRAAALLVLDHIKR